MGDLKSWALNSVERRKKIIADFFSGDDGPTTIRALNALIYCESLRRPITPEQVAAIPAREMLQWPAVGVGTIRDIEEWLGRHGLRPLTLDEILRRNVEQRERAELARLKAKYERIVPQGYE